MQVHVNNESQCYDDNVKVTPNSSPILFSLLIFFISQRPHFIIISMAYVTKWEKGRLTGRNLEKGIASSMEKEIHLFFDDTGLRKPNATLLERRDRMDCFGLGGVLVNGELVDVVKSSHEIFCNKWKISYPLHSRCIRGTKENFVWLRNFEKKNEFYASLNEFLLNIPVLGIATVIHRPGYFERYLERYKEKAWHLDKTAFVILIERSAKYAIRQGRKLRVYFEETGKLEDRRIFSYMRELKSSGMPFNIDTSATYGRLKSSDFKSTVIGTPTRGSKSSKLLQIADLYLYPMAKGGYDKSYRAYSELMEAGRLIDAHLPSSEKNSHGIKYSCFDFQEKGGT